MDVFGQCGCAHGCANEVVDSYGGPFEYFVYSLFYAYANICTNTKTSASDSSPLSGLATGPSRRQGTANSPTRGRILVPGCIPLENTLRCVLIGR